MNVRYEDMRIDHALIKEYQRQLAVDLKRMRGLNDADILLREFEKRFADYIGVNSALAVNSGTDALQLALLGAGIGRGDSVLLPNVTYPAVPLSVIYVGAVPVPVDVREEDLQLDERLLEQKIRKDTKAIIMAHMFSRAGAVEKIKSIAAKHNLVVIEDCCQAESSRYKGKMLGGFGDISCFSFSYYKPLSSCAGGGGMVCFRDDKYRKIADYTKAWKDDQVLLCAGQRFARMNLLDLISVKVKFNYLGKIIKSRIKTKLFYERRLGKSKNVKIFRDNKHNLSVPQNYPVLSERRDKLGAYLRNKGVDWQSPYTPLHLMDIFSRFAQGCFPVSEKYYKQAIQLPLYSFMGEDETEYICGLIGDHRR